VQHEVITLGSELVRSNHFFRFVTICLFISAGWSFAQTPGKAKPEIDYPHEKIYYYNGTTRVEVVVALDEVHLEKVGTQSISSALVANSKNIKVDSKGNAFVTFSAPEFSRNGLNEFASKLDSALAIPSAVLYTVNKPNRSDASITPMILENRVSIKLMAGQSIASILNRYELVIDKEIDFSPNTYILKSTSSDLLYSIQAANDLKENNPAVIIATPLIKRKMKTRFIPNDPLFSQQWHLRNTGQALNSVAGNDVNIEVAWDTATGTGVTIAVIDTGVEVAHTDLATNARTDIDIDINDVDLDPTPLFDSHGTSVAGISAARGNNSIGVAGAAFNSSIVGIRLIEAAFSDADEAQALSHQLTPVSPSDRVDIYNNSWGPFDDAARLETFTALGELAVINGVALGRGGLGAIYVWAAGNGLGSGDNVNYDGYASSRYTVAVGATGGDGTFSFYSEPGASMLINTPSSYSGVGTSTTTTGGAFTSSFGGTSSASPLAAGVISLMLEANPNLTWLDVQHILVQTAVKNDLAHSGWVANGAGLFFNHQYGFGRIDALAAVLAAQSFTTKIPAPILMDSDTVPLAEGAIPDADVNGVTRTGSLNTAVPDYSVEHVEVVVNITHTFRGDLKITLTSPSGMVSTLSEFHLDPGSDYSNWKFTTVAHWGEDPNGTWTLNVVDEANLDTGTLNSWNVTVYGTTTSQLPIPSLKVPFFELRSVKKEN
jgi:subtilisin-like proprotein convertase family protein